MALNKPRVEDSPVILIEEPENHLSFSGLNVLIERIARKCTDRQMLVTTHDSFVLNKLGLDDLILLTPFGGTRLTELRPDTVNYFKKLPGYNTLRLVLAKRVILVEGPSDELVVQRAYWDTHGKLPIQDGIDIMSLDALAAKRFLDIAVPLRKPAVVVTDNDGKPEAAAAKYAAYTHHSFIRVHIGKGEPPTLEPQLLAANSLAILNKVLGKNYKTDEELLKHMEGNKTDCALKIFESPETITMPEYIREAVA